MVQQITHTRSGWNAIRLALFVCFFFVVVRMSMFHCHCIWCALILHRTNTTYLCEVYCRWYEVCVYRGSSLLLPLFKCSSLLLSLFGRALSTNVPPNEMDANAKIQLHLFSITTLSLSLFLSIFLSFCLFRFRSIFFLFCVFLIFYHGSRKMDWKMSKNHVKIKSINKSWWFSVDALATRWWFYYFCFANAWKNKQTKGMFSFTQHFTSMMHKSIFHSM